MGEISVHTHVWATAPGSSGSKPVTRADAALILCEDNEIPHTTRPWVMTMRADAPMFYEAEVPQGDGSGFLYLIRGQCASMIIRPTYTDFIMCGLCVYTCIVLVNRCFDKYIFVLTNALHCPSLH